MGYTYQEARQVWQELRFSIAYTSSDGDLARKLDKFFDISKPPVDVPIERITVKAYDPETGNFKLGEPEPRCTTIAEVDEYKCHCGIRWDMRDERPPCPHGRGQD